jgi:hypothetical protein
MGEKGAYVVQAGRLIKQALSYERNAEYQEAFDLFKAGVDVLLNGVQSECFIPCTLYMYLVVKDHLGLLSSYYAVTCTCTCTSG